MYSPDQADIDPRNPANQSESSSRFIVADYKAGSAGNVTIIDILNQNFGSEQQAEDALLNITTFRGDELDVVKCTDDDQTVVSCFVWDDDAQRYVKA